MSPHYVLIVCVGVCGSSRSLALHPGAWVHRALGSRQAALQLVHQLIQKMAPTALALNLGLGPGQNLGEWLVFWSYSGIKIFPYWFLKYEEAAVYYEVVIEELDGNAHKPTWILNSFSVSTAPIPTVAHTDTTADPAQGPIITNLTVGRTVESADVEVIVTHRCPTAAGT